MVLLVGIIVAVAVILCSNMLDVTRDIDYVEKQQLPYVEPAAEDGRTVFICTSTDAELYHFYVDCDALHSCGREVNQLALANAEKAGRVACTLCRQ